MVSSFKLRQTAKQLHQGAVIAYPTEAVYGLGCDPLNEAAVYRLLALKSRPVEKGLILIASSFEQLSPFVKPLSTEIKSKLEKSWPGPVTWLLPAQEGVPRWLRGEFESIAVRVTAHPAVRAICKQYAGAIVSTSANPAGKAPARSAFRVASYFGREVEIVHAPVGQQLSTSTIIDALTGNVIR